MNNRIIAISFVLLASCTTLNHGVDDPNEDWNGKNVSVLYSQWGEPASTIQLPDLKSTLYIWNIKGCKNNVTTDENGVIRGYAAAGNCSTFQQR